MEEYFRLLGLGCSEELRRRMDVSLRVVDAHSANGIDVGHYAVVSPGYDGRCRIQRADGLCALQRECGEGALPEVCRRYPRAPRLVPFAECSTSASCEKTLELLFESDAPVSFVRRELAFGGDPDANDRERVYTPEEHMAIRDRAFAVICDRTAAFPERMRRLGAELSIVGEESLPSMSVRDAVFGFFEVLARTSENMAGRLRRCREFYAYREIGAYGRLRRMFPGIDVWLEKLYVNHLFYKGFPDSFGSAGEHLFDEYVSLCASMALTMLCAGAEAVDKESFIDSVAGVFRVVEHSRFDECAAAFFHREGFRDARTAAGLLSI